MTPAVAQLAPAAGEVIKQADDRLLPNPPEWIRKGKKQPKSNRAMGPRYRFFFMYAKA